MVPVLVREGAAWLGWYRRGGGSGAWEVELIGLAEGLHRGLKEKSPAGSSRQRVTGGSLPCQGKG